MLLSSLWALLFLPCFSSPVVAQGPVQTLFPAAIPLAVKTPYMNVWYNSWNKSGPLLQSWPLVWNLNSTTSVIGWAGKIRVNGTTYNWMGFNDTSISTNSTNVQITPTRSIFVMQAGPMNVTITFLSPIEPDDWVKQSIPFSYVSLEAQSLDGNDYPVQVYSDISAEWVSGDRSSNVQWSTESTAKSSYHKIQLQNPQNDTEIVDQAQDGTVYYAISTSRPNITWQTGINAATRQQFQANGVLTNADQPGFTSISQHFPVFALAVDLGTIKSTNDTPITWSVGYVRDPSIKYTTVTTATEQRRSYYVTQYADIDDAIDAFTGDYAGAFGRAVALDQKIMSAAAKISPQYSDIVSLATRQTMAALDITVGTDLGTVTLLPGDVKIFMKNLGSGRRVNPVEHIYAAFPMFLYLNASIAGALLQPLLELQASRTDQSPAAQDIGDIYPVVSQPDIVPQQGVEQSGNMLIMELAHARMSGNGTLLSQYYSTTKQWADYLVNNALQSENQTNYDVSSASSANIALKGIIGVRAMAEIAHAVGKDTDATQYGNKASALFNSWLSRATSSDGSHLLGTYDDQKSWSLMYNLFADKMLGLNFVPQSVIDMQTKYLSSLLENASQWGLPIDSSTGQIANAAWSLFASAFVSDTTVRDNLIRSVYNHANSNQSVGVLPERYSVTSNAMDNGRASPGLGGLFSHLVLTVSNKTISVAPTGGSGAGSNSGAIAGGVIGGLAVVGVVVAVFVILRKRCRNRSWCEGAETDVAEPAPHHPTLTPYRMDSTTGSTHRTHGAGSLLDSAPVHVREGTITPFAGIRTGDMGVHHGLTSTANMADAPDTGETTAISLPSPGLSSKRRELPSNRLQREAQPGTIGTSPNTGSQTSSESSRDPSSVGGSHSGSSTDVAGLRNEMENLRRVVLEIREERLEPPPEYAE